MTEKENTKNYKFFRGVWSFVPFLLVFYAISIGPVFGYIFAHNDNLPRSFCVFIEYFYAPLIWVIKQNDHLSEFFGNYVKFFMDLF